MAPDGPRDGARHDPRRRSGETGPIGSTGSWSSRSYGPGGYYDEPPVGTAAARLRRRARTCTRSSASCSAEAIRGPARGARHARSRSDLARGRRGRRHPRSAAPRRARRPRRHGTRRSSGAPARATALRGIAGVEVVRHDPAAKPPTWCSRTSSSTTSRSGGSSGDRGPVEVARRARRRPVRRGAAPGRPPDLAGPPVRAARGRGELVPQERAAAFLIDALARPGSAAPRSRSTTARIDGRGGPATATAAHRVVEDVLAAPGATDITAGVDFGALAARGTDERGCQAFPTVTQHDALVRARVRGLDPRRARATAGPARTRAGREAVGVWGGRSRAPRARRPGRARPPPVVPGHDAGRAGARRGSAPRGSSAGRGRTPAQSPPRRTRSNARYCSHTIEAVSRNITTVAADA